jgi:hypothetical protein
MITCVLVNQSPFTTATLDQFSDYHCYPHCTQEYTLNLIIEACSFTNPVSIAVFGKTCQSLRLNGIHQPFWWNWGHANPSKFLTPDALHAFHKFFFDHPLKWIINIIGGDELNWHMAALQPQLCVWHWRNGISTLKQCTGCEHHNLQKILIAVIMNVVLDHVLCALCAFVKFIFYVQGLLLYDKHLHAMGEALCECHTFKNAIVNAGG